MHIHISGELHFYKASFLLGLLPKYAGLQKTIFWASVWESGFQRMHNIQIFGESQFYNAHFRLWPPLKYAGLRKIIFWASVWDSGLQRMHIHMFGELQFYKSSFLFGLLLKMAA